MKSFAVSVLLASGLGAAVLVIASIIGAALTNVSDLFAPGLAGLVVQTIGTSVLYAAVVALGALIALSRERGARVAHEAVPHNKG